ncbi:hypothetical protein RJT34_17749 [Clitoria ternatea]|uniref:Uncharacterized protein n=1 Tax=Clitoria ternatea TaxID=43366 RepID=A0AAN9J9J1_CLITE
MKLREYCGTLRLNFCENNHEKYASPDHRTTHQLHSSLKSSPPPTIFTCPPTPFHHRHGLSLPRPQLLILRGVSDFEFFLINLSAHLLINLLLQFERRRRSRKPMTSHGSLF